MSWYYTGCCPAPSVQATATPMPTVTPLAYSYSLGVVEDAGNGGTQSVYVSGPQSIAAGAGTTSIGFGGPAVVDDLAVMMPVGSTATATWNAGTSTTSATVPAGSVIVAANSQSYTDTTVVTDGTHTATVPAGTAAADATPILTAAGFTVVPAAGPIPLSLLRARGMADASGNVSWLWALVPSGGGQIQVSGATAS